jgi:hypothetical protein
MTIAMPVPSAPPIDEVRRLRLAQIHDRAPKAEGGFWYSVVTTGVYCRPACPSRRARPENIRLHDTLAQARATGFRPCRRCCPETASVLDRQQASIEAACRLLLHGDPRAHPREHRRHGGDEPFALSPPLPANDRRDAFSLCFAKIAARRLSPRDLIAAAPPN